MRLSLPESAVPASRAGPAPAGGAALRTENRSLNTILFIQRFLTEDDRFDTVHPCLLVKDRDGATFFSSLYSAILGLEQRGLSSLRTISPYKE